MIAADGQPAASAGVSMGPAGSTAVVVVDGVVAPVRTPATHDMGELVAAVVDTATAVAGPGSLRAVTVDVSALLLDAVLREGSALPQVAVVRIVPRPATDPELARSPARLVERLISHRWTVAGGHDLLGNELRPLDEQALAAVCAELVQADVRHLAVVAAGSQGRPEHERAVADALQAAVPGARISAASDFGGQGLIAREATVVLDCTLGRLTDDLLTRWEAALSAHAPGVPLRVARGDGGYSTASRARALPSVTLGAADAAELRGAAHMAAHEDCRVLLRRPGGQVAGDVRRGLPVVRSAQLLELGTALVVPTAVLAPEPGGLDGGEVLRVTDVPIVVAEGDPHLRVCVGVATSQPTGWLDEITYIASAVHLAGTRRQAEERAAAMVTANGAAPGSSYLLESSIVAVPYSPSGTVRIRVRVAGASDVLAHTGPAEHPVGTAS
jgi:hypothetical protein